MLDIKFVRNNPDVVKQNIKNKFQDEKLPLVDEVIELDQKNRDIKGEVEALRAEKNKISKQIGASSLLSFRIICSSSIPSRRISVWVTRLQPLRKWHGLPVPLNAMSL